MYKLHDLCEWLMLGKVFYSDLNLCYCTGPGSLPGYARRGRGGDYDDGASDISSTSGFGSAYGYRSGSSKFST